MYHLARNQEAQKILQAEVDPVFDDNMTVCPHSAVAHISYLRHCIDESLRERPPVGIGLPRITPPEGAVIAGQRIPGNTAVSVPTWSVHHNAELFPDPHEFKPERWTDEKQLPALKRFSLPFSTGG
jgi:benzoate 4-monooxygenase